MKDAIRWIPIKNQKFVLSEQEKWMACDIKESTAGICTSHNNIEMICHFKL